MDNPLSLAFLTLPHVPVPEVIQIAAEAGFSGVGLRLLPATPQEPPYALLDDARALREARAALAETGLRVMDVEIVRLKPETEVAAFRPFLERAQALGARHVLVAGDDADHARLTERFADLCALAAPHGLTADLEFMPWTRVPDLATARAIVEAAGAPNGGVLVDALHFDRSTSTLAEVSALPPALVNYVQLCDGPAEYDPSPEGLATLARTARLFPARARSTSSASPAHSRRGSPSASRCRTSPATAQCPRARAPHAPMPPPARSCAPPNGRRQGRDTKDSFAGADARRVETKYDPNTPRIYTKYALPPAQHPAGGEGAGPATPCVI
jgi:sugar phosphate isomerase/epimerase